MIVIQLAFPYQGVLQQMIYQYPTQKMKDYCFNGVLNWESIANLHLFTSCQHRIPLVVLYEGNLVGYFNFSREIYNPTFVSNAEMILFNPKRGMQAFDRICELLKEFGVKFITFATISDSVADKLWLRKKNIGSYLVRHIGTLESACVSLDQEVKNKNVFQIKL